MKGENTVIENRTPSRLAVVSLLLAVGMMAATAAPQERKSHKFFLGDAPKIEDHEVITQMIVGDADSEGLFTFMNDTWKVGFSVGTHYHKTHFEVFYLLAGEAEWTVNGETHQMKAGDAVYIPANAHHSARTLGDKPAQFLLFYLPGSYEAHIERQRKYTEEQRKDPEIKEMLWKLNDFNPVEKK
jgi:quercetin dioxygenase-like cupin family protein